MTRKYGINLGEYVDEVYNAAKDVLERDELIELSRKLSNETHRHAWDAKSQSYGTGNGSRSGETYIDRQILTTGTTRLKGNMK
jgi:hypothetical protein